MFCSVVLCDIKIITVSPLNHRSAFKNSDNRRSSLNKKRQDKNSELILLFPNFSLKNNRRCLTPNRSGSICFVQKGVSTASTRSSALVLHLFQKEPLKYAKSDRRASRTARRGARRSYKCEGHNITSSLSENRAGKYRTQLTSCRRRSVDRTERHNTHLS
jgi:hypothetical protein